MLGIRSRTGAAASTGGSSSSRIGGISGGGSTMRRVQATSAPEASNAATASAYKNTGPKPQRFTVADGQLFAVIGASLPFVTRAGMGAFATGYKPSWVADDPAVYSAVRSGGKMLQERSDVASFKRPAQPLELYEFEGCPFCKKVREAVTLLALDPIVRPCPVDGATWRPQAMQKGGKRMFPFLVDPNTGRQMYESDDIINYLYDEYGPGRDQVPLLLRLGFFTVLSAGLGLLLRGAVGSRASPSRLPEKPLRMWMYEASPFVKLAREKLCELELPYQQLSVPRGSPRRQEMQDTYGHFQVPFLEDPNTGECMFESKAIVEYLQCTYGAEKK